MRRFPAAAALATSTVLVLAGCGALGGDDVDPGPGRPTSTSSAAPPPDTAPPGTPQAAPTLRPNDSGIAACEEVVAGINAYNRGDFEETVDHFARAVPLAERDDDGSQRARLLVEAVRYYAALAPAAYPSAAATSAEFQRWKAVTLGQCVSGEAEPTAPNTV